MLIGRLHPVPPYDFALSLDAARLLSVMDVTREGEYWRALDVDGAIALIRVVNRGAVDHPALDVYRMAASGPVDDGLLLRRVAHLLGVSAGMSPFYDHIRHDAVLWPLVEPLYGLKHIRMSSLFESLMITIIEQQIALNLAQRSERWLLGWAGNHIDYHGDVFYTFPRPAQIAHATVEDLIPLKITRIRMGVMIAIAQHQVAGQIDLEALGDEPPDSALRQLMALKGVGQWTAAWAVIRATGHYQYIGENDVALQAAINHYFYGQPGRAEKAVVKNTLARYGPYAGAVTFHLLMRWGMARYGVDELLASNTTETSTSPA